MIMVDARDIRASKPKCDHRVKEKPSFEQRQFVSKACEILANTWEYHIDFWPLMFNFKEHIKQWEDYCTVTISSKQFKTAPFKLANCEWEYEFYRYADAFFAVQDFIETLQYDKEVYLEEESDV